MESGKERKTDGQRGDGKTHESARRQRQVTATAVVVRVGVVRVMRVARPARRPDRDRVGRLELEVLHGDCEGCCSRAGISGVRAVFTQGVASSQSNAGMSGLIEW